MRDERKPILLKHRNAFDGILEFHYCSGMSMAAMYPVVSGLVTGRDPHLGLRTKLVACPVMPTAGRLGFHVPRRASAQAEKPPAESTDVPVRGGLLRTGDEAG